MSPRTARDAPIHLSAAAPDVVPNIAKIVTHPPSAFDCRAAAIRDDRILAVWPTFDLLPLVRPATAVNDLGGSTVLPGRIDTHTRTLGAAIFEFDHPPPRMEVIDYILSPFRRRGAVVADVGGIRMQQVLIAKLREHRIRPVPNSMGPPPDTRCIATQGVTGDDAVPRYPANARAVIGAGRVARKMAVDTMTWNTKGIGVRKHQVGQSDPS